MNLQEQIEKAFVAGAEYMRDEAYAVDENGEESHVEMPGEYEILEEATRYIK